MVDQGDAEGGNRAIFTEVVQALFIDLDADKFGEYISDEMYVQHNPLIPDGKEAAVSFLKMVFSGFNHKVEVKHLVVEGDIGVVHAHFTGPDGKASGAIVDVFRLRDGKLVEHWDVMTFKPDLG